MGEGKHGKGVGEVDRTWGGACAHREPLLILGSHGHGQEESRGPSRGGLEAGRLPALTEPLSRAGACGPRSQMGWRAGGRELSSAASTPHRPLQGSLAPPHTRLSVQGRKQIR